MNKQIVIEKIKELDKDIAAMENKVAIFSDRDDVRTKELDRELKVLKTRHRDLDMELLDIMVDGNV